MKILYLNINHGAQEKELFDYLKSKAKVIDIFCLQEADEDVIERLSNEIAGFNVFRSEKKVLKEKFCAVSFFINNKYKLINRRLLLDDNPRIGIAENYEIDFKKGTLKIVNVHGIPQPGDKKDNNERLKQTSDILSGIQKSDLPAIVGGDFNLLPDTNSVMLFEKAGFRNLIKDFDIKTTRSEYAWKEAFERNKKTGYPFFEKQDFADYVFVSPEISVNSFEVPDAGVSDHLPLILDFDL